MSEKHTYEELEHRIRELESAESEYKLLLKEQQQKEIKYQNLFENMLHEVHVWELVYDDFGNIKTWKLVDANPAALKSWGKDLSEIVGKTTDEVFPNSNATTLFMPIVNKIFENDAPHIWETYFPGTNQYLHMISIPFGKYFISTGLDISDRRKIEESLLESTEKFGSLVSNLPGTAYQFVVNQEGEFFFEYMGDNCVDLFGHKAVDILENSDLIFDLIPEPDAGIVNQAIQNSARTMTPYNIEHRIIKENGETLWIHAISTPRKRNNGEVVWDGIGLDITTRKEADNLLKKSEKLLRQVERTAKIGGWEFDISTNTPNWTNEVYDIYETDHIPPVEKGISFYGPEARPVIKKAFSKLLETGDPYDLELPFISGTGKQKWVRAIGRANYRGEKIVKLTGVIQDISQQKLMEGSLKESEEKYRLLYEKAGLGIGYWTPDGKVISFNKTATENLKGEPEEFIGKSAVEVFGNTNGSIYLERITNAATTKQTQSYEDTVILPSGEKTFVSTYNTILAENGDARGVQIISTEITERKKMEKEILKIKTSLEDAQRIANVGSWEWDLRTNDAWWSDELYRIYGREKSLGPPSINNFYSNIHTDDIQHLQTAINNSIKTGEYKTDYRLLTYDTKEIRDVHAEGRVEYNDKGEPIKHLGVVKDVTNQKKLELQLRQAHKMEAIGNLAGGIAHDFNNILSSIIGFTELALDEAPKGSPFEDNLQEVYSAGKRAKDLVKQILAFARQSDEKRSPIQPGKVAREVTNFIHATIPTSIEIREKIDSESLIMCNATQIHQVLMNLCTNAAQAMEDSGGILNVSLKDTILDKKKLSTGMKPVEYVEIKVSDSGIGIPPEIIGSIFDPYFTTKDPGEGTGMGLAMVHGVIESYGGIISVESQLGEGTSFTIYLPITKKRSDQDAYVPEQLPTGTERILFVDDEAPIAKMGSQILERIGYTVTIRTSSVEALELFQARPNDFDLVVTDMTMPNLTGDKLAVELMKIRPDIPVILCTGYSKKMSDEIAGEIGIKAFAYKPVVKADLAKTVRKVLDEAKTENRA